jgi:hypothetical protein
MKSSDLTRREFIAGTAAAASISLLPASSSRIVGASSRAQTAQDSMDRDLLEVTIPKLRAFYEAEVHDDAGDAGT